MHSYYDTDRYLGMNFIFLDLWKCMLHWIGCKVKNPEGALVNFSSDPV